MDLPQQGLQYDSLNVFSWLYRFFLGRRPLYRILLVNTIGTTYNPTGGQSRVKLIAFNALVYGLYCM